MNSTWLKFILIIGLFISTFSIGFSSPVIDGVNDAVTEITSVNNNVTLGLSFILLTLLFTVIFRQGTIRMLPNNSRGAIVVAIILGIFTSVGILSRYDYGENTLVDIGQTILIPLLLLALFAGSWAVLRGIHSANVSGFGKILMYLGFFVLFSFAFIQLLVFAGSSVYESVVKSGFVQGLFSFLQGLLIFFAVIFIAALIFFFFTVREFLDLFEDDDESQLGRARKKKKEKQRKEADTIEQLNQLKKSFHKMKTAYDDKAELLREIANLDSVSTTLDHASEVPPQDPQGRGFEQPYNNGYGGRR